MSRKRGITQLDALQNYGKKVIDLDLVPVEIVCGNLLGMNEFKKLFSGL